MAEHKSSGALVAVVMGSTSHWETMRHARDRDSRRHECRLARRQYPRHHRRKDPEKSRRISKAANRRGADATRSMTQRYLPGATIGLMGSGHLGRMFAIAARRIGYRIHVFSPEKDTPAGQFADREVIGAYEDEAAVRSFARTLDLLTFEFENIPRQTIDWCAGECEVRPNGSI